MPCSTVLYAAITLLPSWPKRRDIRFINLPSKPICFYWREDYPLLMKKVLFATHHPGRASSMETFLGVYDCLTETVTEQSALEAALPGDFQLYLIEANLGYSGTAIIDNAVRAYELVRERVERGEAKFIAFSATPEAVKLLRIREIPACHLGDLVDVIEPYLDD
jgi:hypothetical protein